MPNIAKLLKEEIRRLARREIKGFAARLRKDNARLKRIAADHKRRMVKLEQETRRLLSVAEAYREKSVKTESEEVRTARVTAKMIRKVRDRLGLSQAGLAKLVGVSPMTVCQWEQKQGRLTLRGNTKARIVEVRKLGKREARAQLEGLKGRAELKGEKRAGKRRRQRV